MLSAAPRVLTAAIWMRKEAARPAGGRAGRESGRGAGGPVGRESAAAGRVVSAVFGLVESAVAIPAAATVVDSALPACPPGRLPAIAVSSATPVHRWL